MKNQEGQAENKELIDPFNKANLDFLELFASHLSEEHKLNTFEIASFLNKKISGYNLIPVSIFSNEELGFLEAIVKYLKEEINLSFHEIALVLNRNDRTIWATYRAACKKRKERLDAENSKFFIPSFIFKNRKFSVMELIISYIKVNFSLRYSEIAILLNRDERNIWTAYNNYKKKK